MRETTIHWMNDEKCADVSTCDPRLIAQIEGNGGKGGGIAYPLFPCEVLPEVQRQAAP